MKVDFLRYLVPLKMTAHGFADIQLQVREILALRGNATLSGGVVPRGDIPAADLILLHL